MNSNLTSMIIKHRSILSSIRRYVATSEEATTVRSNARSFLVRFIEERRRKIQQEDIRLEPYMSKGVYTESGAIRPVCSIFID